MAAIDFDVLAQLLEFKWRDVSFPVSEFDSDVDHDHKIHTWPDRDGGHVEGTGRAPIVHHATIHFRNGITAGPSESWSRDGFPLYPNIFRDFLAAFSVRKSGTLQHPELGPVTCKPDKARFSWRAVRRDGCDVTASWIESTDDDVVLRVLMRDSPVPEAKVAALDLDAQIAQYNDPLLTDDPGGDTLSFTERLQQVTAAFDTASLLSAQAGSYIDRITYRVSALEDRILSLRDNSSWPIVNSCERLRSALYDMGQQLLVQDKTVGVWEVQQDCVLASLCAPTQTSITDLLNLNPALAADPIVPSGTRVRYYTS